METISRLTLRNLAEQRKEIIKNWEKSGFLNGLLPDPKSNIEKLLETENENHDSIFFPAIRQIRTLETLKNYGINLI